MRGLAAEAADAALSRDALVALRRAAPEPTAETMAAYVARQRLARAWRACRLCSNELAEPTGNAGRCAGCKRVRYCGAECQRGDWPRHKAECKAWRAEADAAVVAAGGCPLGDVEAQWVAIKKWAVAEKTLAAIRAAAEGGDLAAQYVLSVCFGEGAKGAPRDPAQELTWLRRSAAGNVASAQTQLGFMHKKGEGGLAVDLVEGARLYAKAAAQGLAGAQHNLGCCYRDGEGVPRDLAQAVRLFQQSAEGGDAAAQALLAGLYATGDGVGVDYAAALQWARRSADQGDAQGEYNLAVIYDNGHGVPQDLRLAATFYARAASQGLEGAKKALLELAAEGVAEAVAAVRRLRLAP